MPRQIRERKFLQERTTLILLPFVFSFLTSCSKPLTLAEKTDQQVHKVERAFLAQGVDYNPSVLTNFMLRIYKTLKQTSEKAASQEERAAIEKTTARLKCFLGMSVMYAYGGGHNLKEIPAGSLIIPEDKPRVVSPLSVSQFDFFPHENNIISVKSILDFYKELERQVPDYSFAYSAPAAFLLIYGNWDDAIRLARQALKLNPNDFFALRTLVIAYFVRKEQPKELAQLINRYKKIVGESFLVDFLLSRAAKEFGDIQGAIHYGEAAIGKIRDVNLISYVAHLHEEAGNLEKARYYYSLLLGMSQYAGKPVYDSAQKKLARITQLIKEKKSGKSQTSAKIIGANGK